MPLWVRLSALGLALGMTLFSGLSTLQLTNSLSADKDREGQSLLNAAELNAARIDARIGLARAGLEAAQGRLALKSGDPLSAAEAGLKLAHGNLKSLAIVKSDKTGVVALAGSDDTDLLRKVAGDASDRYTLRTASSRLVTPARPYIVVKGTGGAPDLVGRLDPDLLKGLSGDRLTVLVTREGEIVAASNSQMIGQTVSAALSVKPEQLRARADSRDLIQGARPEGGFIKIASAELSDGLIVLAAASSAQFFSPTASLIRGAAFIGGPLLIGLLFGALLIYQARRSRKDTLQFQASEQRYRLAVEAARCGIWDWDLEQDLIYMSDVTGVMFGWGGGGVATTDEVLARVAAEHRTDVIKALETARLKGSFDVSFRVPSTTGRPLWIDVRGQAVGDR